MSQNTDSIDSTSETRAIAYTKRLNPWAIVRLLPNRQKATVARFRSRCDADCNMQRMRQLTPNASFMVVFDCQPDQAAI